MSPEFVDVIEFGPYKIDREQRVLMKGTCITPLAPKIFELLLALAESGGRVLEKKNLLAKLWPDTFVEEGSLTRNISTLRKILGQSTEDQKYICTVPRRGYRFVAEVKTGLAPVRLGVGPLASVASSARDVGDRYVPLPRPLQSTVVWWGERETAAALIKPEAYDCYLRGRFYAHRQNKDDNDRAISALEHAVAIEPTFAMAYAELAQTYTWKLFLFAPHEGQWQEKAFIAVEKALSLDPELSVAYLARGRLLWTPANHFPHVKAIREYRRALALDPKLDEARNQLALIYSHIGCFDAALRESQEATVANPNNHLAVYRTAQILAFQGKYEQALELLRTIPDDVNPSLIGYQTAWVLFNLGNTKEASTRIDQLLKDYPQDDGALFISVQAVLAASIGEEHRAKTKINVAIKKGKGFGHFHHSAYHIAIAFALMNQAEQAVKWLDAAAMDGFPCYPLFESDANLDNLRKDALFIKFMANLGRRWHDYQGMLETNNPTAAGPIL